MVRRQRAGASIQDEFTKGASISTAVAPTAFTLVELLVVIGIIAVLVGILLPALGKARRAALEIVCQSNMRQWGMGVQMYTNQNKGELPVKGPDGSVAAQTFGPVNGVLGVDDPSLWFNAFAPMINKKSYYDLLIDDYHGGAPGGTPAPCPGGASSIFICPAQGQAVARPGTPDIVDATGNYFLLYGTDSTGYLRNTSGKLAASQFKFDSSYVFNSKLTSPIVGGTQTRIKMSTLRPTSEVVLMTEKIGNYGEYKDPIVQRWSNANPSVYLAKGKLDALGANQNIAQSKADWTRFAARHRGGGFLLFADGHVGYFAWPEVQYNSSQLPLTSKSDANQPGKMIWCPLGPTQ